MSPPRFSVVVPTRERARTLRETLTTCLDQDFDDYEVVVCDNHSSPQTRQVVGEFASPRLRYVRAPEPLTMADNWELAGSQARGEYVTFLGDDDGLLPGALARLDALLAETGAKAVRWDWATYTWPCFGKPGEADWLAVPLTRELEWVEARPRVEAVIALRAGLATLPGPYHGLVHRGALEAVRARAGRAFAGRYPDTFAAYAVAAVLDRYVTVTTPLTVGGLSGHSHGIAHLAQRDRSPVAEEFHAMNARRGWRLHPWVPDLPVAAAVVFESYLSARGLVLPHDGWPEPDRQTLVAEFVRQLWMADREERRAALAAVRRTLADRPDLLDWFDATAAASLEAPPAPGFRHRPAELGFDGTRLHLDAAAFGVTGVAGAAALAGRVLGLKPGRPFDLPHWWKLHHARHQAEAEAYALREQVAGLRRELEGCRVSPRGLPT